MVTCDASLAVARIGPRLAAALVHVSESNPGRLDYCNSTTRCELSIRTHCLAYVPYMTDFLLSYLTDRCLAPVSCLPCITTTFGESHASLFVVRHRTLTTTLTDARGRTILISLMKCLWQDWRIRLNSGTQTNLSRTMRLPRPLPRPLRLAPLLRQEVLRRTAALPDELSLQIFEFLMFESQQPVQISFVNPWRHKVKAIFGE